MAGTMLKVLMAMLLLQASIGYRKREKFEGASEREVEVMTQDGTEFEDASKGEAEAMKYAGEGMQRQSASEGEAEAMELAGRGTDLEDDSESAFEEIREAVDVMDASMYGDEAKEHASEKNGWWGGSPRRRDPTPTPTRPPVGNGAFCTSTYKGPSCLPGSECDFHRRDGTVAAGGGHCHRKEGQPCSAQNKCKYGLECGHFNRGGHCQKKHHVPHHR